MEVHAHPPAAESEPDSPLLVVARRVGTAMSVGMLCGLVIGGVGGRVAMFVLRVTSSSGVNGIESDDGFRIGQISFATVFLLIFAALLGAAGGLVFMLVRQWVPSRLRAPVMGILCGTVVGAAIVEPEGVDFSLLSPLWLAVVLFVLIPAVFGVVVTVLIERTLARQERQGLSPLVFLPLLLVLVGGPLGLGVLVVVALAWLVGNRVPAVGRVWRSRTVVWLGRGGIAVLVLVSVLELTKDVSSIL